jgi:hypothetical protein
MDYELTQPISDLAAATSLRATAMRLHLPEHRKVILRLANILQHVESCLVSLRHTHNDQRCDGHEDGLADIGKRSAADVAAARRALCDVHTALHRHIQRISRSPYSPLPANRTTAILRAAQAAETAAAHAANGLRGGATRSVEDHAMVLYDIGLAVQDMGRVVHNEAVWTEDAARRAADQAHARTLVFLAPRLGDAMNTAVHCLQCAQRRIQSTTQWTQS